PGAFYAVPVSAGTVAFVDAEAVARCMPQDSNWYEDVFESGDPNCWFDLMDDDQPYPPGTANIVMPLAVGGENVILSHSGWGDGLYPILQPETPTGRSPESTST
ncbi:DUF4241 domain-containing protein, partial [Arthrobacter sp. NPDC057388]|uniref:DUF4241 domain-containing protein n=1 Tax=Arthrobacter sp. NPDC057388 TaxID=3346116 RepID=UPI003633C280